MFKSPLDLLESGSVVVLWKVVITKHCGVEVLWSRDSPALQPLKICVEGVPCSDTDAICQAHLPLQINPPFCAVYFFAVEPLRELGCRWLCPPGSCWGTAAPGALHGLTPPTQSCFVKFSLSQRWMSGTDVLLHLFLT